MNRDKQEPQQTQDANGTALFWFLVALVPVGALFYGIDFLFGSAADFLAVPGVIGFVGLWVWLCHRDGIV